MGDRMNFEPCPIPNPIWRGWRPRVLGAGRSNETISRGDVRAPANKDNEIRRQCRAKRQKEKVKHEQGNYQITRNEKLSRVEGEPEGSKADRVCDQKAKGFCERPGCDCGRVKDCQAPGQTCGEGIQYRTRDNGTPHPGARCVCEVGTATRNPA
jgi:hypothetical protein